MKALLRLKGARIWLCNNKPFFGNIALHLNFIEDKTIETCAIDKHGNFYYNSKFVLSLSKDELRGVVLHEVLHCTLMHFYRLNNRNPKLWNIVADAVINFIIVNEGLQLPKKAILVDICTGEVKFGDKVYSVKGKSTEKFYREVYNDNADKLNSNSSIGNSENFDTHIYKDGESNKQDKDITGNEKKLTESDWKQIITQSKLNAKALSGVSKGNVSGDMERMIDDILNPKVNWQSKLRHIVLGQIPYDYTFIRPNKKTHYLPDTYLPSTQKEKVEIIINIDTSGSVSKEDLTLFVSEVVGIKNSYQNIKLILMYSDTRVYTPIELDNPSVREILKHKPSGGGGTAHKPVFEYIDKHYRNAQLVICMTDGQTSFPDKAPKYGVIWLLAGSWKASKDDIPFGEVIEL